MEAVGRPSDEQAFRGELDALFLQRTRISLWLAVVFFPLFAFLDWLVCPEYLGQFFIYRMSYVAMVVGMLGLLRQPMRMELVQTLMYSAMLLGVFSIALMTVSLGGFRSGYHVGILLMIAGAFSVLPLTVRQAFNLGGAVYLVYMGTVLAFLQLGAVNQWVEAVVNSFFFFSILAAVAVQCFADMRTLLASLRSKRSLVASHAELAMYTDNLEILVEHRLRELEETRLQYRDLYDAILDTVILVDGDGTIQKVNQRLTQMTGQPAERYLGQSLLTLLDQENGQGIDFELLDWLRRGDTIIGRQARIVGVENRLVEVEISGSRVTIDEEDAFFQLIIRDITSRKRMQEQVLASDRLIDSSRRTAIFGLARLAECRDDDTGAHLSRIQAYTRILTDELCDHPDFAHQINASFKDDIGQSSILHDIGKVGIPDSILLKPGRLSSEEFAEMKNHCAYGSAALSAGSGQEADISFLAMAKEIVQHHHEWWNGHGYPDGLAGNGIPLAARIVAVADVYDALTTSRPYKPAFNHDKARDIIVSESGSHFDPRVVNALLTREQEFKTTRMNLLLY
jgi:PAS domain S-box-containing protein